MDSTAVNFNKEGLSDREVAREGSPGSRAPECHGETLESRVEDEWWGRRGNFSDGQTADVLKDVNYTPNLLTLCESSYMYASKLVFMQFLNETKIQKSFSELDILHWSFSSCILWWPANCVREIQPLLNKATAFSVHFNEFDSLFSLVTNNSDVFPPTAAYIPGKPGHLEYLTTVNSTLLYPLGHYLSSTGGEVTLLRNGHCPQHIYPPASPHKREHLKEADQGKVAAQQPAWMTDWISLW